MKRAPRRGPQLGRMAVPGRHANLRDHGAAYEYLWWGTAGYTLLGHAWCVTAERNGPNVPANERLPFGALVEADFRPAKRRPPVVMRMTLPLKYETHELVLLEHSMVAVLQPRLVHDHHA